MNCLQVNSLILFVALYQLCTQPDSDTYVNNIPFVVVVYHLPLYFLIPSSETIHDLLISLLYFTTWFLLQGWHYYIALILPPTTPARWLVSRLTEDRLVSQVLRYSLGTRLAIAPSHVHSRLYALRYDVYELFLVVWHIHTSTVGLWNHVGLYTGP